MSADAAGGFALNAQGVTRRFGAVVAVEDFNLSVAQGEFVAVVGPSGCGKTTLLNLLAGHDAPTSGRVSRASVTRMVYQSDGLFPWLTVAENIGMGLRHIRDGEERQRRLSDMVTLIQLQGFEGHYPHQLSGGMRQRVELARALSSEAEILLMDEPFSALDYITRLRMRQELARILDLRPHTVVFVTHDIEEAAQLADRVVVLSERPARVRCELRIELPRPRSLTHPQVVGAIHRVLAAMGLEEEVRQA